jgi:hypothetical protein
MFVQYFGVVELPFADAEAALLDMASGLGAPADVAYRRGEDLLATIGIGGPGLVAKQVILDVGEPMRGEGRTSMPVSWSATGTPSLFPTMKADLSVTAVGRSLTQVMLQGTYTPPLGAVGRVIDRALLHRFAELSVKDFVDRIVQAMSPVRDGTPAVGE